MHLTDLEGHRFLSTPSARRATNRRSGSRGSSLISIHALREEGDIINGFQMAQVQLFLSTPSARRATETVYALTWVISISIHALREEGDGPGRQLRVILGNFYPRPPRGGRLSSRPSEPRPTNFYPRPPRGGRHYPQEDLQDIRNISIHALREEGDRRAFGDVRHVIHFYPRPPRGGRPPFAPSVPHQQKVFLSTPSARRATC